MHRIFGLIFVAIIITLCVVVTGVLMIKLFNLIFGKAGSILPKLDKEYKRDNRIVKMEEAFDDYVKKQNEEKMREREIDESLMKKRSERAAKLAQIKQQEGSKSQVKPRGAIRRDRY
ncbi:hypothetical protein DB313_05515 (plasmid) [Borrelia turcica IST7]|uniref:Uncharacterized protein n=1 Tax=Borrelia turcica IST7 TaxID=1104446 RepID=A0A386PPM5_9SPIR|nr:hypothetical protein [Borrelia turcica]AYE36955.1 hypothetical protein DB313_05515 [Borrelia turcica IST7]